MKTWFTSDLHFCHDKEFIWKARGFNSVDEMNRAIVDRWNAAVDPEDTVWVLGDVIFGDVDRNLKWLARLNGYINIVAGNHDSDKKIDAYITLPKVTFNNHATCIKMGKRRYMLSHHQMITKNGSEKHVPWNLHGHTHSQNKFCEYANCYNVNMDAHNCTPVSAEQIMSDINDFYQKQEKKKELKWYQKLLYKGVKGLC